MGYRSKQRILNRGISNDQETLKQMLNILRNGGEELEWVEGKRRLGGEEGGESLQDYTGNAQVTDQQTDSQECILHIHMK